MPIQHNQRLEFLGDAVLQLALTRELYEKFPAVDEGPLTKARAKLVNRRTLAVHGRVHWPGTRTWSSVVAKKHTAVGNARPRWPTRFESVIGAIFLDGGYEVARQFILREFSPAFTELDAIPLLENPKGELQELLQAKSPDAPKYLVVSATGPDHDRVFECTVHHGGIELGSGSGKSKKAAESEAALNALKKLREEKLPT